VAWLYLLLRTHAAAAASLFILCCSDFYRAWLPWVCLGLWHGFAGFYVPTLTLLLLLLHPC
jgi:hypothetical protein